MQQNGTRTDHWEHTSWHRQFQNNGHQGFTGSEMEPFLVKLYRILNVLRCFFLLPFTAPLFLPYEFQQP